MTAATLELQPGRHRQARDRLRMGALMSNLDEQFNAALREPNLILKLDRNLLGGQALVYLLKPGATERSKSIKLTPVIVGAEGQTHASMLRMIADAMEQSGRAVS